MSHRGILTADVENANQIHEPPRLGRVERAVTKLFASEVEITRYEAIGRHYRVFTVSGETARVADWQPGDFFQFLFPGWQARAYTPFVATRGGEISFLAHIHGDGIASSFFASARVGDRCLVFGPRRGVDLSSPSRPLLVFGDESGLATAGAALCTARGVASVFEVGDGGAAREALDAICYAGDVTFVMRGRLDVVRERFRGHPDLRAALTGNAASIKYLYRTLRGDGVLARRIANTPYWAAGKTGLD